MNQKLVKNPIKRKNEAIWENKFTCLYRIRLNSITPNKYQSSEDIIGNETIN